MRDQSAAATLPLPQKAIRDFHGELIAALKEFAPDGHGRVTPAVAEAFKAGTLLTWHHYLACLNASSVPSDRSAKIIESYTLASGALSLFPSARQGRHAQPWGARPAPPSAHPPGRRPPPPPPSPTPEMTGTALPRRPAPAAPPGHRPLVGTADWELDAAEVPDFMKLLRLVQVRSGLNPNQLAKITRMPVSSAYRMFDEATRTLPTKGNYVAGLMFACGLPPAQVDRVMAVWRALRLKHQVKQQVPADVVSSSPPVVGVPQAKPDVPRAGEQELEPPRPQLGTPMGLQVPARVHVEPEDAPTEKLVCLTERPGVVNRHVARKRRAQRAQRVRARLSIAVSLTVAMLLLAGLVHSVTTGSAGADRMQDAHGTDGTQDVGEPAQQSSAVPTTSTVPPTPSPAPATGHRLKLPLLID